MSIFFLANNNFMKYIRTQKVDIYELVLYKNRYPIIYEHQIIWDSWFFDGFVKLQNKTIKNKYIYSEEH